MKAAVISLTLAVLYLCILQAESQKVCQRRVWQGGCKQAKKLKIKKILLKNIGGCSLRCAATKDCTAFDFPKRVRKGKVNVCNLYRAGCTKQGARKWFFKCISGKTIAPLKKLKINHRDCGIPFKDPEGRVIGGKPAVRGQFPWQVAIMRKTTHSSFKKEGLSKWRHGKRGDHWYASAKNLFAHCGGSVLNEKYILTAAHCFSNDVSAYDPKDVKQMTPGRYEVLLGRNDLAKSGKNEVGDGSARRFIKRIILHPDWHPYENSYEKESNSYDNDIAILELSKPVRIGKYIRSICIPGGAPKISKIQRSE
jgi:hypothetical protein